MSSGLFSTSLEKALQLCLVFLKPWLSPRLVNTERELLFEIVLSGWGCGCLSREMPELLLALLSPSSLSDSVVLAHSRGVWCTQVQHTGALLSRKALQSDHPAVMTGCTTRTANHSKLSTFYDIHRWKERGVALFICLHLLEQPERCFRAGSQHGPGIAASGIGPWWNQSPGWLPEWGSGGWAEPVWELAVVTFPNSCLLIQPSPKSRDHQAKQTQLCKTNQVPKASTDTPSFPGKENHCWRCLPSLRAAGLGLLFGFLAFGVLCCNLYLNTADREDVCSVCLFGVFFLFLWLLKDWRVYCVWNTGRV